MRARFSAISKNETVIFSQICGFNSILTLQIVLIFYSRYFNNFKGKVNDSVTICSFKHTGATKIFELTGYITKLKRALGNSSINVSST